MYEIDNAIQYGEDLEPKEMPVRYLACNVYYINIRTISDVESDVNA